MTPTALPPVTSLQNFKGFYRRGGYDCCPQDYLNVCENCQIDGMDITVRDGLGFIFSTDQPMVQYFVYSSQVKWVDHTYPYTAYPMLYMDPGGSLYDAGSIPNTLLASYPGATGFAAIELFGRVFLCPTQNSVAMYGSTLSYFDVSGLHDAAGPPPGTPPTVDELGTGNVTAGFHVFAISFEYSTGFLSSPSPIAGVDCTGDHAVHVSNIPIGGSGVTNRYILMTLANQSEFFFVPGAIIGNNEIDPGTGLIRTDYDVTVADTALLSSADYLNDIMPSLPGAASLHFYNGRLIMTSPITAPFQVWVSNPLAFDSFNSVTGIINIPRDNTINAPNTIIVLRNIMYILKPFGTYATQDNGNTPDTWNVTIVDPVLGGYDTGVTSFSSGLSGSDIFDTAFIIHPRGLLLFNGFYSDRPLTFNIEDFWPDMSHGYDPTFAKAKIAHNPITKKVYIISGLLPEILLMDYSRGLGPDSVMWFHWKTDAISKFTYASVILDQGGKFLTTFCNGSNGQLNVFAPGQIYDLSPGIMIMQNLTTPGIVGKTGWRTCFNGVRLRVEGSGQLLIYVFNEGQVNSDLAPAQFSLDSPAAKDYYKGMNVTNEKIYLSLFNRTDVSTLVLGYFKFMRLDVFGIPRWSVRAQTTFFIITSVVSHAPFNPNLATITTQSNHGYNAGDYFNVTGVTGCPDINGTWRVDSVPDPTSINVVKTLTQFYTGGGIVFKP